MIVRLYRFLCLLAALIPSAASLPAAGASAVMSISARPLPEPGSRRTSGENGRPSERVSLEMLAIGKADPARHVTPPDHDLLPPDSGQPRLPAPLAGRADPGRWASGMFADATRLPPSRGPPAGLPA